MTGPLPLHASRRGVVGGAVAAVVASGCDVVAPAEEPHEDAAPTSEPTSARGADPDADLVDDVVSDVVGTAGVVAGVARARRTLRSEITAWERLHRTHLTALDADAEPRPDPVSGSREELRALVRRRETALQRRLADAAVTARSGALASLLATMSAGIAQQLEAGKAKGR